MDLIAELVEAQDHIGRGPSHYLAQTSTGCLSYVKAICELFTAMLARISCYLKTFYEVDKVYRVYRVYNVYPLDNFDSDNWMIAEMDNCYSYILYSVSL